MAGGRRHPELPPTRHGRRVEGLASEEAGSESQLSGKLRTKLREGTEEPKNWVSKEDVNGWLRWLCPAALGGAA